MFCIYLCVCEKEREKQSPNHISSHSSPPPLCAEQPGWSWGGICKCRLSVRLPLQQAAEQHAASCTHTLTAECRELGRLKPSQQVSHKHVCVYTELKLFLETHSHTLFPPPFLCPVLLSLSPYPSSCTPLCCFPCPLFLPSPLPLQPSLSFPLRSAPMCSDCG